ncbi:MAG TPA: aminotransferase class V-fold PLP-dependent enzyme [Bryobacteraceae bacterium]|nr:aminotransferase class V-fold PLP-dependent enzyme [Bryobacteraceae bacterium]
MQSRRTFFKSAPAVAAVPAVWTALAAALQAAGKPPGKPTEDYWNLLRKQFPLEEGLIYLNAANLCPASRPVLDRYSDFMRDMHANPSFQNREKYKSHYESLRSKLAVLLGSEADEIAITRNTSEGSNIIVRGIDLKAGDEVVITDHNHQSNKESWQIRARREGIVIKSVPVTVPAVSAEHLLDGIRKAITSRTKVIAVTHVTSTTGLLYPAREIAALARPRGIWMHLDGAQSFGAIRVNLKEIGCDSYSGSAHKWAMGPFEAGVLFVRKDRLPQVWPSIVTAGWADDLAGARKLENLGQRDEPRIVAFEAAVDFLNLVGMEQVETRLRYLAGYLKERLADISRVQLKTNRQPELAAGVVKFAITGKDIPESYNQLYARHRIALAKTDTGNAAGLRFSPHVYNGTGDLDRALAAVRMLI